MNVTLFGFTLDESQQWKPFPLFIQSDSYQLCVRLSAVQRSSAQRLLSHAVCCWVHRTQRLRLPGRTHTHTLLHTHTHEHAVMSQSFVLSGVTCSLAPPPSRRAVTWTTAVCAGGRVLHRTSTTASPISPNPTQTKSSTLEPPASRRVLVRFFLHNRRFNNLKSCFCKTSGYQLHVESSIISFSPLLCLPVSR